MKFPFVMNPLAVALTVAFAGNALAQSNKSQGEQTIEVVGKAESLTQSTVQNAKELVKAIPGGASIVDLNQVREGRQATWSQVFTSKIVLVQRKRVWPFVVQV
jgi:tartrate dehydratase beta subunit/fumarate hydratase class I family protein